jgi:ERCC4-type nuclease
MNPATGSSIHITIDDRERRGPVPSALKAHGGFRVEIRRLAIGDYCVDESLLFERKTLRDVVCSIADGRLFSQALRLVKSSQPAALILEGRGSDLCAGGMRREAIQGALLNVSLFIGLPVLRTRDPAETVRTMGYAARQCHALAHGALPRHGRRPKGKAALQSHILQGLPGIGPQRAARLLHRFGSVEAAFLADAEAIAEVDGIGPVVASKMRWAVEEPLVDYRLSSSASRSRTNARFAQHERWSAAEL